MSPLRRWPAAVLALLLLSAAGAGAAPDSRYTAFLRVTTLYPTAQLKVWISDDGQAWRYLSSSQPFATAEASGGPHPGYLFALEYLPAYVRFGVEGAFLGRLSVDSVEAFVGTQPRAPLEITPLGSVLNPDNIRVKDGQPAILFHRGQEGVDGFVLRFDPTPKPPDHGAKRIYWGNYVGPRDASDAMAQALAWWDFSFFQQGDHLEECVRKVKALNPQQRICLRLWIAGQSPLLYAYDQESRDAIREQVVSQFSSFADLVDTVSLSEEEPGNTMRGWMFGDLVPAGVWLYKDEFERETGKPFVWRSPEVMEWLGDKFQFELNDLYDYLHKRYPKIKVYQFVELRGYGNISGFPEFIRGEDLKMDGYVLEWAMTGPEERLVDTPLGPASVSSSFFANYLHNVMERNHLRVDQILAQVWPYTGDEQEFWREVEGIRATGVPYIYCFWPNAGLPQLTDTYGADTTNTDAVQKIWKDFQPYIEAERKARGENH
jgi:hypothetical protein